MACITKQRVGKYVYLYESISYINAEKKVRNRKTRIGKIDVSTGNPVFDEEYVNRLKTEGKKLPDVKQEPVQIAAKETNRAVDIALKVLDSVKDYGSYYLLEQISKKIGLHTILEQVFSKTWREVFMLACYLVLSDRPLMYCEDWAQSTEIPFVHPVSSQRISELLASFDSRERNSFYTEWGRHIAEQECIALDITSISSYSELIGEVEWGYNRDHEQLPQVNLCMLLGEKSRLPVYQTIYNGSLKDVTTLYNTLAEHKALLPEIRLQIVMDKGFYSKKNIDMMLHPENGCQFIISVPFTDSFAKRQVENERKDIDQIDRTLLTGGMPIRGIHKTRAWGNGQQVETFVMFNPQKELQERNDLYRFVTELVHDAQKEPNSKEHAEDYRKYLNIRRSEYAEGGHTVNIRKEVISEELKTAGWMVLISNCVYDTQAALDIYRSKDVVEKGFYRLKNSMDLNRLRVHNDIRMQNKCFIGFLSLILLSHIHKVMREHALYKSMSLDQMLLLLGRIKKSSINGISVIRPLTKAQKDIFAAFKVELPIG